MSNYRKLRQLVKMVWELKAEAKKMTGEAKSYRQALALEYQTRLLILAGRVK